MSFLLFRRMTYGWRSVRLHSSCTEVSLHVDERSRTEQNCFQCLYVELDQGLLWGLKKSLDLTKAIYWLNGWVLLLSSLPIIERLGGSISCI